MKLYSGREKSNNHTRYVNKPKQFQFSEHD